MNSTASPASSPLRVLSLESRRAEEMRSLIERQGGFAVIAPSLREIPLEENSTALELGEQLFAGGIDVLIFLTGVGATALMEILTTRWSQADVVQAMSRSTVVVRGPKPTTVLREWGLRIDHRAPEPNTWREVLALLDQHVPLSARRVAIQEYGKPNKELEAALVERGARVMTVPVYRWALPEDLGPLRAAIQATLRGEFDVILFTSAQQFHHVLEVAAETDDALRWLSAASQTVIGSIGPTATETLRDGGLAVDIEPTHPKMGPLVREALQAAPERLARKRNLPSVH